MIPKVKKYIDDKDIKGIRYVFIDALDADPTFDKYKETYEECKKVEGLFEDYQEFNSLSSNKCEWDKEYWKNLKIDLEKNFSQKRFEHMIQVARVVYAEKVEKLYNKRELENISASKDDKDTIKVDSIETINIEKSVMDDPEEKQEKSLKEKSKKLEEEEEIKEKQRKEKERKEKERVQRELQGSNNNDNNGDRTSKKVKGIVTLIVAIIVLIIIIVVINVIIKWDNPPTKQRKVSPTSQLVRLINMIII